MKDVKDRKAMLIDLVLRFSLDNKHTLKSKGHTRLLVLVSNQNDCSIYSRGGRFWKIHYQYQMFTQYNLSYTRVSPASVGKTAIKILPTSESFSFVFSFFYMQVLKPSSLRDFFLRLDNTLHHHIISITYVDQLAAIYAILMNSSTDKNSIMKLSPNTWIDRRFSMYDIFDGQSLSFTTTNGFTYNILEPPINFTLIGKKLQISNPKRECKSF